MTRSCEYLIKDVMCAGGGQLDCSNIVCVVSVWFPSVFWDAPNVQRHSPKWNSGWGGKVQLANFPSVLI